MSDGRPQLPCLNCGTELVDAAETTTEVERGFQFGGETATREVPAKVCPACGEVTAL